MATAIPYPNDLAGTATGSAAASGAAAASQLPGYMTSMNNIGTNIASETAGQVPEDVIQQLQQGAAESGSVTGAGSNAAYLKALGLTSLGLQEQGLTDLTKILPATPGYETSQNPAFQTSAALSYEEKLQQQVFALQQQQQQEALQQQQLALQTAQKGARAGSTTWGSPLTPASPRSVPAGVDSSQLPGFWNAPGPTMVTGPQNTVTGSADPYAAWSAANPWANTAPPPYGASPAMGPSGTPLTPDTSPWINPIFNMPEADVNSAQAGLTPDQIADETAFAAAGGAQ